VAEDWIEDATESQTARANWTNVGDGAQRMTRRLNSALENERPADPVVAQKGVGYYLVKIPIRPSLRLGGCAFAHSGREGDRQPRQGAEINPWAPLGTFCERELPRPHDESLERSLGLVAGEGCANAVVNAAPERKRFHVATADVEGVCGVVAAFVVVRRAESEHDGVLGLDLDPLDLR
jgi:hypothetical protein